MYVSNGLDFFCLQYLFPDLHNHFPLWLLQNIDDVKHSRRTKVPVFDLETGARSGLKELEVSEECAVVSLNCFTTSFYCTNRFTFLFFALVVKTLFLKDE